MTISRQKDLEQRVMQDPSSSFWLKEQIEATDERDVLDVMKDVEILLSIIHQRFNEKTSAVGCMDN